MAFYAPRYWELLHSVAAVAITFVICAALVAGMKSKEASPIEVVAISALLVLLKDLVGQMLHEILKRFRHRKVRDFLLFEIAAIEEGAAISSANAILHLALAEEICGLGVSSDSLQAISSLRDDYQRWDRKRNFGRYSNLSEADRLKLRTRFELLKEEVFK